MIKRRTRAEIAEDNRSAVLQAARHHFERHGFHGASLDAMAEDAGFSKGAIYSRFASKDDVFLAVLADHIDARNRALTLQVADPQTPADLPRLIEAAILANVQTVAWQAALLEFRAHAWRHPEINARYADLHRRTVDFVAESMTALFRRGGRTPSLAPNVMAVLGLIAGTGVVAEHMSNAHLDIGALTTILARLFEPAPDNGGNDRD